MMRKESGSNSLTFFCRLSADLNCLRVRVCLRAGTVSASESACGQGLRTGAHLRCFPSHRCAAGPSPFTKPRAATPSEVPAHPAFPCRGIMLRPWAAGIIPVLTSALHRFASLGLNSRIAARFAPDLTSLLHRFASLGLKSRIDARIAPVLSFWLHRFASLGLKSRIDARIAPVLTLRLHRFASLGLKSRIDARIALVLTFLLHRFASLGLKSRIDARIALVLTFLLHRFAVWA